MERSVTPVARPILFFLLGISFVVYLSGLPGDLTGDAVKYASITKDMMLSGDFINIKDLGNPYLQKPPLLFWLTSLSFSIFGFSNVGYKFIPVLLALFSGYATYRFAKLYYHKSVAELSGLILLSCFAYFFFHNDVHTDSLLTSFVIIGLWQISEHLNSGSWTNFYIAMLMFAAAMLTKGPVGILVPAFAVFGHLKLKRQWNQIFHWKWLIGGIFVFLLLIPGLLGLFNQFGWDGLVFYFWTNNFGRITGTYERNNNDYFFYVHTFLWLFLPWALLSLLAIGRAVKKVYVSGFKLKGKEEGFTVSGILVYVLIISIASFKSPHYLMVILPLFSIVTANELYRLRDSLVLFRVQSVIVGLLVLGLILLNVTIQPSSFAVIFLLMAIGMGGIWYWVKYSDSMSRLILPSILVVSMVALYFNATLLPSLFEYQSAVQAGKRMNVLPHQPKVYSYGLQGNSLNAFHFYYDGQVSYLYDTASLQQVLGSEGQWFYASEQGLQEMIQQGVKVTSKQLFLHNSLQAPRPKFINPATREQQVERRFLVQVSLP
jgi:4-amino-4-deoxy-L-arabinose transferase-like glycosyltransferase